MFDMLIPVYVDGPPFNGQLQAWGRACDGWWGLLIWPQRVVYRRPEEHDSLRCAAWVPAARLRQLHHSAAHDVPRLRLDGPRSAWPAPPAWDGWYAGAWATDAMPLPDGVEPDRSPAWRRR